MSLRSLLRSSSLTTVVLLALAAPAQAQERAGTEFGIGAGAALCSIVYGPAKLVYAITGAIITPLAFALSGGDADVAKRILTSSLRGDYVVTPAHLRGERPLEFVGRDPADRQLQESPYPDYETGPGTNF